MLRKDHCLPDNAKFESAGCSLINSLNWIHVMSDITLHVNMKPLTADDQLLIKTSQTDKSWIVEKMIVAFPARQWKWHIMFDLVRIIYSTGFTKRLVAIDIL